jgi:NAD(P)-dependent dehydrogenase (short-subunit alcohol dehydrogenase family)
MHVCITGANRGIGLELARLYAARGDQVTATTRGAVPDDLKDRVTWHKLDVTDQNSLAAFRSGLADAPLNLLICNAGMLNDRSEGLSDGYAAGLWADCFAVNVTGVFQTIQAALPGLRAATGARIAIIASKMGSDSFPGGNSLIYRASKAAAINLARNLALDLAPEKIAVGAYHPGWVQTDMGGAAADITAVASATGLQAAFDALSPATSGCFQNYDGSELPH